MKTTAKPCSWCTQGELQIGAGLFRDFDSDLSYGIPICPGCGGLGIQIDTEDFQANTKRIGELRSEYCPQDNLPEPFPGLQLNTLIELERTVRGHWDAFGSQASHECPAAKIAEGALRPLMEDCQMQLDKVLVLLQKAKLDTSGGRTKKSRDAVIAAWKGNLDDAEALWKQAMDEYPESAVIVHDYAAFLVAFRRSYELAAPHFERACLMKPKKALHYFQAAQCFFALKEKTKARRFALRARAHREFLSLSPELRRGIQDLLRMLQTSSAN